MRKSDAVAELGPHSLSLPGWVKAALSANDRLKLCLTILQTAASHAEHPHRDLPDLQGEMSAAGLAQPWLKELPVSASKAGDGYFIAELPQLAGVLHDDISTMARPVMETIPAHTDDAMDAASLQKRLAHWQGFLKDLQRDHLGQAELRALTHGHRGEDDSLHILVMDLHKRINKLAAGLASEDLDGAHVWQLDEPDRPRVRAFMTGLHRTAPLKFDHPGLDTAATHDGERLLIQNDIGTNDAHVLVIQVTPARITLTYSDLHRTRFAFFQQLLTRHGAAWSVIEPHVSEGLNRGEAYWVGTATFDVEGEPALLKALESLGASVVFLIDWNRARKRLQLFVDKAAAQQVLMETAQQETGHMAWLKAGGERLIFDAMQALGEETFRIGDRLDTVLGEVAAQSFLVELLARASQALLANKPTALVADEARMLLAHYVQRRGSGFDMLSEHAAYCQALAQQVRDGLAHGAHRSRSDAEEISARAKSWERRADHLVIKAREHASRQPHWRHLARLLQDADDVADALEEAAFMLTLIADGHHHGWHGDVQRALEQLAGTVLDATQEQVKALAIAHALDAPGAATSQVTLPTLQATGARLATQPDGDDHDAFLTATWNVVQAERRCDELLRHARRVIFKSTDDAASLMLANDLAMTLELASDRLLAGAHALRDLVMNQTEGGQ